MNEKHDTYQSIPCSSYDQLEAYATTRTHCSIVYQDDAEKTAAGVIVDIFSKEGAEYLMLENSIVIRLDTILSINGNHIGKHC